MERITLTVREMAQSLGICRSKAYALTQRADFPTVRLGKKVVIPVAALQEWLAKGGTEPKGEQGA